VEQFREDDSDRLDGQDEDDGYEEEAVPAEEYRARNVREQQDERVEVVAGHVGLEERLREDIEDEEVDDEGDPGEGEAAPPAPTAESPG
jgi:hypothetical protein